MNNTATPVTAFFVGTLFVASGEIESTLPRLIVASNVSKAHKVLDGVAQNLYGGPVSAGTSAHDGYTFFAGEVRVTVSRDIKKVSPGTFMDLKDVLPVDYAVDEDPVHFAPRLPASVHDAIEGLYDSESDEGCDGGFTVVEKRFVTQLHQLAVADKTQA